METVRGEEVEGAAWTAAEGATVTTAVRSIAATKAKPESILTSEERRPVALGCAGRPIARAERGGFSLTPALRGGRWACGTIPYARAAAWAAADAECGRIARGAGTAPPEFAFELERLSMRSTAEAER